MRFDVCPVVMTSTELRLFVINTTSNILKKKIGDNVTNK